MKSDTLKPEQPRSIELRKATCRDSQQPFPLNHTTSTQQIPGLLKLHQTLVALIIAGGLALAGRAQNITYNVNEVMGTGGIFGTITTDGNTGVLNAPDILSWNLTVIGSDGSTFNLNIGNSGVEVGNNTDVFNPVAGTPDLTADTNNIYFNFSGTDGGYLGFQTSPFYAGQQYASFGANNNSDTAQGLGAVPILYSDPSSIYIAESGNQIIASTGGTLSGHVYDLYTSLAISNATVQLTTNIATTDTTGYYAISNIASGSYLTMVSATNYPSIFTNLNIYYSQTADFYLGKSDLGMVLMTWDATNSGLDFVYTNRGSALSNATIAQIFWATGPTTNDIMRNLPAIATTHIPAGFMGGGSNLVTETHFNSPPDNATYVQVVLDPDNLVKEYTKTNNALALPLTFRHVVLVMMENRSFDHFLGWLPGANGKQAGLLYQNNAGQTYKTYDLAPYYQGCGCVLPDQAFGAYTEFDNGYCDGWLRANTNDTYTICYYSQADLPFWGQTAPYWTVCDNYFAPLMAETQPNRIYQHAATTDALTNRDFGATISGAIKYNPIKLPTIWDTLMHSNISAFYYHEGSGPPQSILTLWGYTKYFNIVKSTDDFYGDCIFGNLPSVSFVDPLFTAPSWAAVLTDILKVPGYDTTGNDYHPHSDIRNGEAFLMRIYNAIATSPQWSSTVLIINFDEWGGFFDHVAPPMGPVTQDEYNLGNHGQLGFRVPCMIISPWAKRATVYSAKQFDHTSVLKLIEDHWGLPPLAVRDAAANDLTNAMDFADPPNYAIPALNPGVLNSPFGGYCQYIQIINLPDGKKAAVWDATCLKVVIQTTPNLDTDIPIWTDQTNILAPPYIFGTSGASGYIRLHILGTGYVAPAL